MPIESKNILETIVEAGRQFEFGDFLPAAAMYSAVIRDGDERDERIVHCRLNRSAAYLRLGYLAAAGRDARYVYEICKAGASLSSGLGAEAMKKALWRIARSWYSRRNYQLAKESFEEMIRASPAPVIEAEEGMRLVELRLREQKKGEYPLVDFLREGLKGPLGLIDAADYKGAIEIKRLPSRGGGRGIVASRDVKQGELLLVEKAFDIAFATGSGLDFDYTASTIDLKRKIVFSPTRAQHIEGIVAKLTDDPSLIPIINSLYAGPEYPNPPFPAVTTTPAAVDGSSKDSSEIAMDRIEAVCTFNE